MTGSLEIQLAACNWTYSITVTSYEAPLASTSKDYLPFYALCLLCFPYTQLFIYFFFAFQYIIF